MKKTIFALLLVLISASSCYGVRKQPRYTFLYADEKGCIRVMDNATFNEVNFKRYNNTSTAKK